MAQTGTANYPIPNDTGSNFRADVNENLTDLYSTSSGSSAPPGAIDNQMWVDTSTTPDTLKIKQGSSWITLGTIETNFGLSPANSPTFSGTLNLAAGSASSLPLRVVGDTDTGLFFATNTVNIHAGGTTAHEFTASYSTPKVPLRVPDGTASAPSITNSGDENTGLYFPAADQVGFTAGGTTRAYVSSAGIHIKHRSELRLNDTDNSHYVSLRSPGTVSSNVNLVLPDNDGNNGDFLKSDGSGNLSWAAQATTSLICKGAIAFTGSNGSATKASNLTVSRTGTGRYTVTLDTSIRTGNTNYGVVVGSINEAQSDGTNSHNQGGDNLYRAWLDTRSNNSFTINAQKWIGAQGGFGGDDEDRGWYMYRAAVDPAYICLMVF